MTPTADQMVVLTSTLQKLATKRVVASRNGPPVIEDYPRGSTHFRFEEWPVASFDEMAAALATLQARPFSLVVRGRILEGTDRRRALRRALGRTPTLEAAARRCIAIDLDSIPCPAGIDPVYDVDAVVEYVTSLLPEAFHGASCFWSFTGSHGIKPGIRLRLWFWADRPFEDWELKAWLRDSPVDLSLYSPAQPIYVARPISVGMPDPVPYRHGIWRGYSDTVEVPTIEKPQARAASSLSTPGRCGGGYDLYREHIGDHDGGDGFYGPLKQAIGSYFHEQDADADAQWLRSDLEDAIRSAQRDPAKHDDPYVEHRVRDLDPWIAWTREQEAANADAQSQPAEPTYPAPMGSVDEARAVLAASVREFANEARAYRDYRDRLKAEGGDTIPDPPPVRGSSVGVGLGKTRSAREELVTPLTAEGLPVVVAVPQHKLGDEFVRDLVQDGATGRVYRGRTADDPDAAGEKMCREHERTTAIFNALGDIGQNACRSDDGAHQCDFFNVCGYQKQMQAAPQTWVVPHQLMFHPRPKFIAAPAALVIDEGFYNASLHGADRPIWLDLAALLGDRTIPEQIYGRSAGATADLTAVSRRAYDAITSDDACGSIRAGS